MQIKNSRIFKYNKLKKYWNMIYKNNELILKLKNKTIIFY